jgi:hypothetical protein
MKTLTPTAQRFQFHYNPAEQRATVARLLNSGMGDHAVAELTGLSVQQVRSVVAERRTGKSE